MDFNYNKEQKMFQDSARNFFSKEWSYEFLREVLEGKGYMEKHWNKLADLGWLGMLIDEKYEGIGAEFIDLCPILEEMGRVLYPGPFFASSIMGVSLLSSAASDSIKEKLLPAIADGDVIVTAALGQTGKKYTGGSKLIGAEKAGNGYLLTGTVMFVPYADVSDYIIFLAEDSSGKKTFFLVDAKSQGIESVPVSTFSIEKYNKVILSGVRVPEENILGEPGMGEVILEKLMPVLLMSRCMEMVGGSQKTLDITLQYVKDRKQFGKPLGSFQAIQHQCAEMAIDVETSKFITYKAAWKLSQKKDCKKEVSMAKAWSADAYRKVTAFAMQAHGAMGFTEECNLHFYYKQAKSMQLMYGSGAYHRNIVADEMGY